MDSGQAGKAGRDGLEKGQNSSDTDGGLVRIHVPHGMESIASERMVDTLKTVKLGPVAGESRFKPNRCRLASVEIQTMVTGLVGANGLIGTVDTGTDGGLVVIRTLNAEEDFVRVLLGHISKTV